MTFRDYAQGAFRMRGIGRGQTIVLYLIPEVEELISHELKVPRALRRLLYNLPQQTVSGRPEIDVPAWLLVNSMNVASLQYCKLAMQGMHALTVRPLPAFLFFFFFWNLDRI
jgi:hypothetical protein